MPSKCKVAAIQAEPCWNDLKGSIAKTIGLIQEAAGKGANVIGFPEIFIPGYPWTIWANSPVSNAAFMSEYFKNSLEKESEEMEQIKTAVREAGVFIVLGYSERYQGSLYISQYSQNLDIQVSSWPLCWDALEGQPWPYHLTPPACNRFSQVMAMEGACYVLVCSQVLTEDSKAKTGLEKFDYARAPGGGFSMIYGPDGSELCKPLGPGEEGILYADVDLSFRAMMQQNLDLVGHYSRPDLLSLNVTTETAVPIRHKWHVWPCRREKRRRECHYLYTIVMNA
ncbi:hypothetical protein FOMG_17080 [Fusarium oxysporum f. sp. melonis 26406]|uniref:nitrilase n=1 Tax=Fusarium oxysporum f. sp. melonis 26406 TaxID=1089452 RepID=W9ZCL4_FUSOX|nr:hypothetical protein FOMG_17080 [Fusarium oxysporum f. sp. melonis 26406]